MKRIMAAVCIILLLSGCKQDIDKPMEVRKKLTAGGCTFSSSVTADYGDRVYHFIMDCQMDQNGSLNFTVTEPESISGITGKIEDKKGALTFDDKVLMFPILSEGQLTPVSGPWHLMHTLRSGYIAGSGTDGNLTHILLDDSYEENPMHVEAWVQEDDIPVRGEILYKGRRILTVTVENFKFM